MPTYEYLCNKCEHAFEAVQSFTEPAIQNCPQCKGEVRKVYNNVGVVFKGSGFYKTDSGTTPTTKSDTPTAKTESTSTPKAETATSTKKESKTPPKSSE